MKTKPFILLSLLLVLIKGQGQTNAYHSFPDSNAIWCETYYNNTCNCPGTPCSTTCGYYNQYFIHGDTLFGSQIYHKLYKKSNYFQNVGTFPISISFAGGLRQNLVTKKVYFCKLPNINDTLLYDLSLLVGDTLKGYLSIGTPQTVSLIDSIKIGTTFRKRFNFINGYCIGNYSFIEGIGSNKGLFNKCDNFEEGGVLNCFMQNGKTIFPDTNTNCASLLLGINEIKNDHNAKINVFPNPNTGLFTFSAIEKGNSIEIFDTAGKLVYQTTAKDNSVVVNLEGKEKGIYLYRITNSKQEVRQGKLIVK